MAALGALGALASLGGSLAGAAGQRVSGSLEKTRKYLEAQEMMRKANDVEGVADRKIANIQDDADRVVSAQRAAAASQGFDTADTGITDLTGKVAARAAREQVQERRDGISQAADLILGAGRTMAAGDAAKRAASMQSMGTIIGGVGSAVGSAAKGASGFQDFLASKQIGGGWRSAAGQPDMRSSGTGGLYG